MSKGAVDTQNAVRDFINDGGKLFFTGKNAGRVFAEGFPYNPFQVEEGTYCKRNPSCVIAQDDFLQYYLGAYRYVGGGGEDDTGQPFDVEGTLNPFVPLNLTFNGADSADNGDHTATMLVTSSVLDPVDYPLWADSKSVARWARPFASPFDPHDGDWFLSAGADDVAYKRLLKPFAIPAAGGTVKLFASYDLEPNYDYMFVEIHTVGEDDWTTLADANGNTSADTGLSCPTTGDGSAWQTNHPFLAHYQTVIDSGNACTATGFSGSWNATTGNSGGWQDWSLPIPPAYHGENVEISVSVVTDPAFLGLGAWVDELRVVDAADAPINSSDPSFESGHRRLDAARAAAAARSVRPVRRDRLGACAERAVRGDADRDDERHRLHGLRLRSRRRHEQPQRAHAVRADASRSTAQAGLRRAAADRDEPSWATTPAGYWRLGETSGTTMSDSSPAANHGTYLNGVTLGVPGALVGDTNTAASFDGVNDQGRVPDSASLDVGDSFTLEGWIKRPSAAQAHDLFVKGANGLHLTVMGAGSGNQVWLRKSGVSTIVRSAVGVPADGSWHHVVATKNGPGTAKIYVDGVASTVGVSVNQVVQNTALPLVLAGNASTAAPRDELAIYDQALSAAEVLEHYQLGRGVS